MKQTDNKKKLKTKTVCSPSHGVKLTCVSIFLFFIFSSVFAAFLPRPPFFPSPFRFFLFFFFFFHLKMFLRLVVYTERLGKRRSVGNFTPTAVIAFKAACAQTALEVMISKRRAKSDHRLKIIMPLRK